MATFGIDYLGGAAFADLVTSHHPAGMAAGFFAEEFGNALPVVRKLAASGKAPVIRVHALWDSAHRYGTAQQVQTVRATLRKYCGIAKANPKVRFLFSPYCEHNLKVAEMEKTLAVCRTVLRNQKTSNVELVNCIWQGQEVPGVINEVHGDHGVPKTKGYVYSFDGLDCYNANTQQIKNRHAKADLFFFWTISMNLKKKENEKLTVAQRLARAYRPKAVHIDAMAAMVAARGRTSVPSSVTIKPMSEDCGDAKSNKLLVILPEKYSTVELKRNNGRGDAVATLKRFDPPLDGPRYRYYAGEAGCRYVKKNLVYLVADGKILNHGKNKILFNPAFRDGTYRD